MHLIANLRRLAARSSSLFIAVAASAPSTRGRVMGGFTLPVETQWDDRCLPAGDYRFVVSSATSRARVYVRSDDSTMLFRASIEWAPGAPGGHLCLVYDESGYRVRSLKLRDARQIFTFDDSRVRPRPPQARRWSGVLYLPLKSPGDGLGNSQEHGTSPQPGRDVSSQSIRFEEASMFSSATNRLTTRLLFSVAIIGALTLGGSRGVSGSTRALDDSTPPPLRFETDTIHPPCHPNLRAQLDMATVATRGDIRSLPLSLRQRLVRLAGRPHSTLPIQAFAEADQPSRLFQYYLIDTHGFERNVFTTIFPGVNDAVDRTVTGADCGLSTIGSVRLVVEPKPDLPTDPNDVRAFIDVFTDIHPLFVINNESGWYEGWMIHDLRVAPVAPPRPNGKAQFGTILQVDADQLRNLGTGNDVPGHLFTTDGGAPRFPSESDHFPDIHGNLVPIYLSMGAYNSLQQSDVHSYWEFNYTTDWVFPLYELPFTGGIPGTFEAGQIGALNDLVPGSGPAGFQNDPTQYGDSPFLPRDPDKFDGEDDAQREFRDRFIPSGLAHEIYLDVFERTASFEPGLNSLPQRIFDAYAKEVALVDQNRDGVISSVEGDVDSASDGFEDNARLFLPATSYDRFAVTREINDGMLAPRFANSQRAWVMTGFATAVAPAVPASAGRDSDDR